MLATRSRYMLYLLIQILIIVLVLSLFKLIPEKSTAAVIAGCLFNLLGLSIVLAEIRFKKIKSLSFWLALIFLVFFAMPIMAARLIYWGVPFDEVSILGIPTQFFHQWSSKVYMLMMLAAILDWLRNR